MITLSDSQIRSIASDLEGTLNSEEQAINYELDTDIESLDEVDDSITKLYDIVDRCCVCGWWYRAFELDYYEGDLMCDDCAEDEYGEDYDV